MKLNSTWDANSCSASWEFLWLLLNQNVHYLVLRSPPLVTALRHMNLVHTQNYFIFFQDPFNVIFRSTRRYSSGPFASCFPIKSFYAFLISLTHVSCPARLILLKFYQPSQISLILQIMKYLIFNFSPSFPTISYLTTILIIATKIFVWYYI
jgi:hypothetical protein